MCGDAGPLALGAILYHKIDNKSESDKCLKRYIHLLLLRICSNIFSFQILVSCFYRLMSRSIDVLDDDSLPNELLFGRAGFLWALLFVQKNLGSAAIEGTTIPKVEQCLVNV